MESVPTVQVVQAFLADPAVSCPVFDRLSARVTAREIIAGLGDAPALLSMHNVPGTASDEVVALVGAIERRAARGIGTACYCSGYVGSGGPTVAAACSPRVIAPGAYFRFHGATLYAPDGSRYRDPAHDRWTARVLARHVRASPDTVASWLAPWWDDSPPWVDLGAGEILAAGLADLVGTDADAAWLLHSAGGGRRC